MRFVSLPFALASLAALSSGAQAQAPGGSTDDGRSERVEALYAHRMTFDRTGEPRVTVGLAKGLARLELVTEGVVDLLPEGEEAFGVRLPRGIALSVTVESARQGRRRHWVVAERYTPSGFDRAAAARAAFDGAGVTSALVEAGALTGAGGRLFDTRTLTLAVSPGDSPAAARAGLARARAAGYVDGDPLVELAERPGGVIVAQAGELEIRARDLLWIRPAPGALTEVRVDGQPSRRYASELYLTFGADGRMVLGNLASAETILESVVPSETFPTAPQAALEAQAVVARGQFMAKLGLKHRDDPYMLCNRWHCQAHGGQGKASRQTTAAVRATRGEVLVNKKGGLVDTVYHSACGGQTEGWDQSWGGDARAGLMGVEDVAGGPERASGARDAEALLGPGAPAAWCAASGKRNGVYRWTRELTGAALTKAANKLAPVGPVTDLVVTRRGRGGRVLGLTVIGTKGKHLVDSDPAVRRLLGGLKSAFFVLRREGPAGAEALKWRVVGGGYGHGIGLCQHGAIGMANAGHDHRRILEHYFPGTRIESIW